MKPLLPPIEEYYDEIKDIWDSKWLSNDGPKHKKFETQLQNHLGANNLSLFTNGTLALDLAIQSLDLEGEVITTPFTFAATSHVLISNRLTPVFCDIELETFNIDPNKIENLITDKTTAIMPVHIFGNPADVKKIRRIAKKHDLQVIYDAAQAFGVEIEGESIANFGDITMFSLHATKVFNSIEGGVLAYKDNKLKEKLEQMKNFGFDKKKKPQFVGTNAKMNEFQAIMGSLNLKYYQEEIQKRKNVTKHYKQRLNKLDGIDFSDDIEGVTHNYAYFPILVTDEFSVSRDELLGHLKKHNIFPEKYYAPLCSEYEVYESYHIKQGNLSNARYVSGRILALPIYGDLSEEEIDYICSCINKLA